MDLLSTTEEYRPDEGFVVELRGPTDAQLFNDDETPMTITVIGADSDIAVKARNAQQNRRLQQGVRAKLTAEGLESDAAGYLAKLTVDWNVTMGGEKPACTYEAAVKIYSTPKLAFIREQVDAAIADRANFLRASPTS